MTWRAADVTRCGGSGCSLPTAVAAQNRPIQLPTPERTGGPANGLATVIRVWIDRDAIAEALGLTISRCCSLRPSDTRKDRMVSLLGIANLT